MEIWNKSCRSPGSGKQETKGTSLGLTFSLSLQRLSPEQLWLTRARTALDPRCWHVAGPSFCTPANTHLGPTVIPEQINCYVGAKEGQGDLWEVPLWGEGTVLVSPRQADRTHMSFWDKVEMPEHDSEVPPYFCILVSRQASPLMHSCSPAFMLWRNATTRQILPWLWQGLQVSLHLGNLFSGSLCVELTILDILQGSTGASLPPGSLPSACRRESGFLVWKSQRITLFGTWVGMWLVGKSVKNAVTSGGWTLSGRQDGPQASWVGTVLMSWLRAAPTPSPECWLQLTALPSWRTCLGPVGLQAWPFPHGVRSEFRPLWPEHFTLRVPFILIFSFVKAIGSIGAGAWAPGHSIPILHSFDLLMNSSAGWHTPRCPLSARHSPYWNGPSEQRVLTPSKAHSQQRRQVLISSFLIVIRVYQILSLQLKEPSSTSWDNRILHHHEIPFSVLTHNCSHRISLDEALEPKATLPCTQ